MGEKITPIAPTKRPRRLFNRSLRKCRIQRNVKELNYWVSCRYWAWCQEWWGITQLQKVQACWNKKTPHTLLINLCRSQVLGKHKGKDNPFHCNSITHEFCWDSWGGGGWLLWISLRQHLDLTLLASQFLYRQLLFQTWDPATWRSSCVAPESWNPTRAKSLDSSPKHLKWQMSEV